eukprot:1178800-Prorocentrum_minimum.AAC.2
MKKGAVHTRFGERLPVTIAGDFRESRELGSMWSKYLAGSGKVATRPSASYAVATSVCAPSVSKVYTVWKGPAPRSTVNGQPAAQLVVRLRRVRTGMGESYPPAGESYPPADESYPPVGWACLLHRVYCKTDNR